MLARPGASSARHLSQMNHRRDGGQSLGVLEGGEPAASELEAQGGEEDRGGGPEQRSTSVLGHQR